MGIILLFVLISQIITFIMIIFPFWLICHLLQGIGLYCIAKRRGITSKWAAWCPSANHWFIGHIADQYRSHIRKPERNYASKLLKLMITQIAICGFIAVLSVFGLFAAGLSGDENVLSVLTVSFFVQLALCVILLVFRILYLVALYRSYYDLFCSCNPQRRVLFLVMGIITGFFIGIFVFACREQDLGMVIPEEPLDAPSEEAVDVAASLPFDEVGKDTSETLVAV